MSKNIEKLQKEKDLEKIKPEKELKHEPKELKEPKDFKDKDLKDKDNKDHKDQKDNKEHKEHKDLKDKNEKHEKHEPKEIKEPKDHKEIVKEKHEPKEFKEFRKEIKELEKDVKELEGKDLVEQPDLPDLSGQPVSTLRADAFAVAKSSDKQIEKIKAEKEFTKHEPKEKLEPKEFKDKPEKYEKHEKHEFEKHFIKDLKEHGKEAENKLTETRQEIPGGPVPGAEGTALEARLARLEGAVAKQLEKNVEKNVEKKLEKVEYKDKFEKIEHKDKFEKYERKEKIEIKEFKIEKAEHGKEFIAEKLLEVGIDPGPLGPDPAQTKFEATGTVEERVSRLENALLRMSHFIGVDLRPDLSAGALNREPDVAPPPPTKPDVAPPAPTKPDVAPPPPTKPEPNKPK